MSFSVSNEFIKRYRFSLMLSLALLISTHGQPTWAQLAQGQKPAPGAQLIAELQGLAGATDLAVIPSADGNESYTIIIADGITGRLNAWQPSSKQTIFADELVAGPILLESASNGQLIVTTDPITTFTLTEGEVKRSRVMVNRKTLPEAKQEVALSITALTTSDRYLFVISDQMLLCSRRNDQRFNALRLFDAQLDLDQGEATSLCFAEKGHLVIACSNGTNAELAFCNPYESSPPSRIGVEGISRIDSLSYGLIPRPAEPRLYALVKENSNTKSEESANQPTGLYRLDAIAPQEGQLQCRAKLIVPLDRPIAFTLAPDGTAYFLALTQEGEGVLLHADEPF